MLYIGIDLGTSAVKLLLMDETGKIEQVVSREYPISFPRAGWSEQNPEDWLRETCEGLQQLTQHVDRTQIAGIGVGGQMHGLVALDAQDAVLRPAILWNDGRAAQETEYLNNVIGREKLSAWTANIAFAGFTAPKVLWMRREEPELFSKIAKLMLPKDYINYMLSGTFATDVSDASGTLLFDVEHKCWSEDMLELCGLQRSQMPEIFESYDPIGTLRSEIAQRLGFPTTVVLAAGAGDNAAAAVGTGTVGTGACNLSLGTSGTIFISSDTFRADPSHALHAFAHADGHYHLMGCMLSAASCNKWWMDQILRRTDYAAAQSGITEERLGSNAVFFLPYLMGERCPHNDPDARGMFLGMRMDSTQEDMTQAVLEGVAFGMRDSLEIARSLGIEITRSKICGGGAKSPLWKTIFANVLQIELDVIETEEGPGYGGAMLAAVACGAYPSVEDISGRLVRVVDTVRPDKDIAARYERKYRQFTQLYPTVQPLFAAMKEGR